MKRLFIIVVISIASFLHLYSQERTFKPFKVDCGLTFGVPLDNNTGSGAGVYIEPRYGVNDHLTIGLRVEGVYLNAGTVIMNFTSIKVNSTVIAPILLTGDYSFSLEKVRPFIGLGLGMYKKTIRSVELSDEGIYIGPRTITNFGFAPRIGLNIGHARLAAIYNYTGTGISDFLGIQAGFEFGGGSINK